MPKGMTPLPDQVLAMVVAQLLGAFTAALIATVSTLVKKIGVESEMVQLSTAIGQLDADIALTCFEHAEGWERSCLLETTWATAWMH